MVVRIIVVVVDLEDFVDGEMFRFVAVANIGVKNTMPLPSSHN
jgi:hypothetical protein